MVTGAQGLQRIFESLVMSALETALRHIEQQRQIREGVQSLSGPMPVRLLTQEPGTRRGARWLQAVVVVLAMALIGTWLFISGLLPIMRLPSNGATPLPTAVVAQPAPPSPPALPVVSVPEPVLPVLPATFQPDTPEPGVKLAQVQGKFTFPAWHKPADQLWDQGRWEDASRLWLKGIRDQDPKTQVLLIADNQTLAQATKRQSAWAQLLPVVVVPKKAGPNKRWLLFAVPVASDLARAQQLLSLATGQAVTVGSLAHWLDVLESAKSNATDQPKPVTLAPAPSLAAVVPAAPAAAAAKVSQPAVEPEPKEAKPSKLEAEPPQLSRTDAGQMPKTGPVSTAAKSIDVEFQIIEKSLARAEHQVALDAVSKLEKYIGENWRTKYLAGVAYIGLARWDQAIAALTSAQNQNPGHAMAALYLSIALQERGEHAKAIQVLVKAQESQPNSPELWLNQGHSLQALGNKAEARNAYNRFLELSMSRQDLAAQRTWVQNRLQKDNG